MISIINEVISTLRGASQGAREDVEMAKRHRGKLGVLGGSLGTLYLMRKYNKPLAKSLAKFKKDED